MAKETNNISSHAMGVTATQHSTWVPCSNDLIMFYGTPSSEEVVWLQVLEKVVANSLKEAHNRELTSIAIGIPSDADTPSEVSAVLTCDTIQAFCCTNPNTTVKEAKVFCDGNDDEYDEVKKVGILH